MATNTTRREFLKLSAAGLAVSSSSLGTFAKETASGESKAGSISVYVTGGSQRFALAPAIAWKQGSPSSSNTITLTPARKFQDVLGFGAAFTDAACYTFNRLSASELESIFHELFHPSAMGLNVCRTCVGSSDYATKVYSYDEGDPDPELKRFSVDHDKQYILPILRKARKVNPDLFLFSSPWSPPGWMKSNKSMLGGNMRREFMPSYANYFLKFLQAYEEEGVPIQAITVQNEVDTDQDGRMPACIWPQEYEADFVRQNLGPTFEKAGVKTKIWLVDHNYNLWGRAIGELETSDVRRYANAIAWHGYVGQPEWIDRVREAYPDAEMYWTEGGPDYTRPDYATDWCSWSKTFTGILRHWCRSITGWNLALDEKGRPNIGPFSCGGLVTVHSQTKEITRSGQHAAFMHYSSRIRRGARRFDSQSRSTTVDHVALENPDGERVMVLTNPGAQQTVSIELDKLYADVTLATDSVTTLTWK
jgi:glucosylceramidase